MVMIIDGTNGLTFPDTSKQYNSYYNFKNRIINGAMVIDQRNAGASVTSLASDVYSVDRWFGGASVTSKYTMQRSTTTASGFINSLLITSSSAYSVPSGEQYRLEQRIEGLNVFDLGWGAAGASTVTLSFWVRSSLTGQFGGCITNSPATTGYPFAFTINSANTFEYKTITIPGPTSGTWNTNANAGVCVRFNIGSGSTWLATANSWQSGDFMGATGSQSLLGTNGATFFITGVQLEKGTQATSFDYRAYGTELALCQRYFQRVGDGGNSFAVLGVGRFSSSTAASIRFPWSVPMRTTPSGSFNTATYVFWEGTTARSVGAISFYSSGTDGVEGDIATTSATSGAMTQLRGNAGSPNAPYINLSAEL